MNGNCVRNLAKKLSTTLLLGFFFCVSLHSQNVFVRGEIVTDTTIRFAVKSSGPQFLLYYVVTRCDTAGACCVSHVEAELLPDRSLVQQWSDSLSDENPFVSFPSAPTFVDFNFDGYLDICFECFWSSTRPPNQLGFFRQYDPSSHRFELAHQFDKLEGEITILEDKTIKSFVEMGSGGEEWIETRYKYRGRNLEIIERVERRWENNGFKIIVQRPVKGVLKTVSVRRD